MWNDFCYYFQAKLQENNGSVIMKNQFDSAAG